MEIREIHDKNEWNDFLSTQDPFIYVQSWEYGEFNKQLGDDFCVYGIYDKNKLIGGAMFLEINAKRGRFLYSPYTPIINYSDTNALNTFFDHMKVVAKEKKVDFIRISPFTDNDPRYISNLNKVGFIKAPMHMIAETTWILPLKGDETELLQNMKQNHRNLIRRAEKDGVKVVVSDQVKDVSKLHELLVTTSKRHKFVPFSLNYLETEFATFQESDSVKILLAYHDDDLLAGAIVFFYGDTAVYKHGASSMLKPKIPASYAIQWTAIKEAKKRGLKYYNFWGIAPEGDTKHPFYGITHFKKGFGGFQKDLIPAHDLKITPKYWINYVIETFRRLIRGF